MYGDRIVEIDKLTTGFRVEVFDPDKHKKNEENRSKRHKGHDVPYSYDDPHTTHAFDTVAEVVSFLTKLLPKIDKHPDDKDTMGAHFALAVKEDDK